MQQLINKLYFFVSFGWQSLFSAPGDYIWLNVALIVAFLLIRVYLFLRFIFPRLPHRPSLLTLSFTVQLEFWVGLLLAVLVAPLLEEILFRSPILYYSLQGNMSWALFLVVVLAITFGLFHVANFLFIKHALVTADKFSWAIILDNTLGGLLYGLLTVFTQSLWPAIVLHLLSNLIGKFLEYLGSKKVLALSQVLQR